MFQDRTVAAIATPPGRGGIAVIRLTGSDSYTIAEKVFSPDKAEKKLIDAKGYTALYGQFVKDGEPFDEGIALCFRAPHSYTGEDVVELSCHGGEMVTQQLLLACIKAGAKPAEAGEFTKRAVLNGRMSITQAESVMELIEAASVQGAALANAGVEGKLHFQIEEQRQKLMQLAGHLAAWIDYPEEDVENLTVDEFIETAETVKLKLKMMIADYEKGAIIRRGVRTAIVGSPNVGKSTLFNLLSGSDSAIVTPIAGTTRDVIREQVNIGGITLHLADTAGLHKTEDIVENEGIKRSNRELETATFVIAVFDGSQQMEEEQQTLIERCKNCKSLAILNKSDLGTVVKKENLGVYFTKVIEISAYDGQAALGIIEKSIREILDVENIDTDVAALMNERQLSSAILAEQALSDAIEALNSGYSFDAAGVCLDDALTELDILSGRNLSDEVISEVFSKFCVGK